MGKRGIAPKGAALPAGLWGAEPSISQADAESILGSPISEEVWDAICQAFEDYGAQIGLLDAPRANQNRNDKASYDAARRKAIKYLKRGKPLSELGIDHQLLRQFAENAELAALSTKAGVAWFRDHPDQFAERYDWRVLLRTDPDAIKKSLMILQEAEPRPFQPIGVGQVKAELARRLSAIFERANLPAELSTGYELPEWAAEADMTPFEQLISALGVHEAERPSALSAWLRECLQSRN